MILVQSDLEYGVPPPRRRMRGDGDGRRGMNCHLGGM